MSKDKTNKKTSIGGQALMEGIMMRGPYKTAMAVRRANGEIVIEEIPHKKKSIWQKIPIIRGVYSFVASMTLGSKTLMRSAEISMEDIGEEEEDLGDNPTPKQLKKAEKRKEKERVKKEKIEQKISALEEKYEKDKEIRIHNFENTNPDEAKRATFVKKESARRKKLDKEIKSRRMGEGGPLMQVVMVGATLIGIALAVVLFFFLPTWSYQGLAKLFDIKQDNSYSAQLIQSAVEGVIKIIIFIIYIELCTLMKEICTVFRYHGAEHMSIFCYEAGDELTVENVRKYKRFHPRCGTSFLIIMIVMGIVTGMFIPQGWVIRPLLKLALIPVVMGVGYELLKLCGRFDNIITRIISAPGIWMQRLTTRRPTDKQIECAIAALKEVIPDDGSDEW